MRLLAKTKAGAFISKMNAPSKIFTGQPLALGPECLGILRVKREA
jgi:hypothetical protein